MWFGPAYYNPTLYSSNNHTTVYTKSLELLFYFRSQKPFFLFFPFKIKLTFVSLSHKEMLCKFQELTSLTHVMSLQRGVI